MSTNIFYVISGSTTLTNLSLLYLTCSQVLGLLQQIPDNGYATFTGLAQKHAYFYASRSTAFALKAIVIIIIFKINIQPM